MNKRTLITGLILTVALVAGILAVRKNPGTAVVKVEVGGAKVKGPSDAPVKIVEYSDFQCPACQRAQATLEALFREYPGKIQLTYMHYPLPMHQWAGLAHQAGECANQQGKFWEYHDKVYAQQAVWSAAKNPSELLIAYAKDAGVDLDKFGGCLSDPVITKKILDEKAKGQALQVSSTPTIFINGERVVGPMEMEMRSRNIVRKALGMELLPEVKPASAKVPAPAQAAQALAAAAAASPKPLPSPSPKQS